MKYLFDTDHISFVQRGVGRECAAILRRVAQHIPADFAVCRVSLHEQTLGAHNAVHSAKTPADAIRGYDLFQDILDSYCKATVLPFDAPATVVFGVLRATPVRIPTMDLRIASIALANHITLLTRNTKDFGKVPGLVIEDWTV